MSLKKLLSKSSIGLAVLMMLLVLVGLWQWQTGVTKQNLPKECERIFTSGIYRSYCQDLTTYMESHPSYHQLAQSSPSEETLDFVALLTIAKQTLPPTAKLQRRQHTLFVDQLRYALRQLSLTNQEVNSPAHQLAQIIVQWIYLKNNLAENIEDFFYAAVPQPQSDLLTYLPSMQKKLHDSPQLDGIYSHSSIEDHYLHGNLPWPVASQSTTTPLIRMGKPLHAHVGWKAYFSHPSVTEEFLYFAWTQPGHLYINLMKREGKEGAGSKAIEQLDIQIPQLHVATLDKNSTFYWQTEQPEIMAIDLFKSNYLKHLTANNGNYYWPAKVIKDSSAWRQSLKTCLDKVQNTYFRDHEDLTRYERQDFIELSYLVIIENLIAELQPSSFNMTCNHGIDRAPSLIALWLLYNKQISDRQIAALLFAPPLLVHNRTAHASRIERFVHAAQRLRERQ